MPNVCTVTAIRSTLVHCELGLGSISPRGVRNGKDAKITMIRIYQGEGIEIKEREALNPQVHPCRLISPIT